MMVKMWMVRAGEKAYLISDFLDNAIIAMGWEEIGNLENLPSYEKIKEKVISIYPEYHVGKTGMTASQLKKFKSDLGIDDQIITYDPSTRNYHVGLVKSDYIFKEQIPYYPHQRNVEWIGKISRDTLSTSTKNTLGGISTLFEISGFQKDEIIDKLQGKSLDAAQSEEDIDVGSLKDDVISRSIEFIKDRLQGMDWEEMQNVVAGLLRASGFKTYVSPRGPDRGRDIIASPDGMGLKEPKIVVEVKHRTGTMGAPEIRKFSGGLRPGIKGLFVSTGGFTKEAKYEAERANIPITLLNLDQLVDMIVQYYDHFDVEARTLIPLTKFYWPV